MQPSKDIARLIEIMAALRTPRTGCPWDLEQDFKSIAPYTIEEAYEVADAIERGDMDDLKEELGDLLLQVVYHARMASESGLFDFGDVVEAITTKMINRHPHVFGDERARNAGMAKGMWERIKTEEKRSRGKQGNFRQLDGVPDALPALTRAFKLQSKAAKVGFDWQKVDPVLDKIGEETDELRAALSSGSKDEMENEIGDLLFSVTNLARHLGVNPEQALSRTNSRFVKRFSHIEDTLAAEGKNIAEVPLEDMEMLWQQAKKLPQTP